MRCAARITLVLTAAAPVLIACPGGSDGPLPPSELLAYQSCTSDADCWVAKNEPPGCCGPTTFDNFVPVSRAEIGALEDAFEKMSCEDAVRCVPPIPDSVLQNRYELACVVDICVLLDEHRDSGKTCSEAMPCPSAYQCVEQANGEVCLYQGEEAKCTLELEAPKTPVRPSDARRPSLEPCPSGWELRAGPGGASFCDPQSDPRANECGESGANFPDSTECAQIHEPCGPDGFPTNLPSDGTPIERLAPAASIGDAIARAVPGSIIATGAGTFNESFDIDRNVTLWGCGEATELTGAITTSGDLVSIYNLILRGPNASITSGGLFTRLQRVLISGTAGTAWSVSGGAQGGATWLIVRNAAQAFDVGGGSKVELFHSSIDGNDQGLIARDPFSEVYLHDVIASRTRVGPALSVQNGATLEGESWLLEENTKFALIADGGTITATHTFITTTAFNTGDDGSVAVLVTGGGRLDLTRAYFERNANATIFARHAGTSVLLNEVIVASTLFPDTDRLAAAFAVESGASFDVRRAVLADSGRTAITVSGAGTSANLRELVIDGVREGSPDTSAFLVAEGGNLAVIGAEVSRVEGAGADATGAESRLEMRGVRFSDLSKFGIYATFGARIEADGISIKSAGGSAVRAVDPGTAVILSGASIEDSRAVEENGQGGFGLLAEAGAYLKLSESRISGCRHAGIAAVGAGTTLVLEDVEVRNTLALADGKGGRGVSIESGAYAELETVSIANNRELGLLALGASTEVLARKIRLENTAGIGAAAFGGAQLSLDPFIARDNAAAGVARGESSALILGVGRIEANAIGANLEGSADLSMVCFAENERDVFSTDLGLPNPTNLD